MNTQLNDLDILEEEFTAVRSRLSTAVRTLDDLVAVNEKFDDLENTYMQWKGHTEAWPPLEDRAKSAANACVEAKGELDERFETLRGQLNKAVDGRIAGLQEQLFATVDNAKADFANRLNSHRGEIERGISVLRDDVDVAVERLRNRITQLDHDIAKLRSDHEARLITLDEGFKACDVSIGYLKTNARGLSRRIWILWAGVAGAVVLSVLIGRVWWS